jgi:2,4-dienoyl-CoA reductase-like NADH-dependent reductase (Old Yellow Enzyme family)
VPRRRNANPEIDRLRAARDPEEMELRSDLHQSLASPSAVTPHLFTPLTLRGVRFPNRIGVSPMCQYSSVDGFVNDWHVVHLGTRAVGGAGMVMVEASAVEADGRITPGDLGIWSDEHIAGLSRIVRFIVDHGAVPAIQIAHAGRKASCDLPWRGGLQLSLEEGGWQTVAPSPIPFLPGERPPRELSREEIGTIASSFVAAARRALEAGFQVIEIHGAHGYLISEFLSPLTNRRTDDYGGSFENRTRLLREIVAAVRAVMPDSLPLFVRVSATDWGEHGWDGDDTVRLAAMLKPLGVDLLDCSSGGVVPDVKIPVAPGFQGPFAARVRQEAGLPSAAVGMITEARQADAIIRNGEADMVLLARELLRNPYWPHWAARELGVELPVPNQYLRSF